MPAKKKTTPKAEVKVITPVMLQEQFVDGLLHDLVATIKALAPGRDFTSVLKAERYLTQKAK